MKKRIFSILIAAVMVAALVAGCGAKSDSGSSSGDSSSDGGGATHKFALVVQGPVNDGSWNTGAYNGINALKEEYGDAIETDYTEASDSSAFEEVFRNYVTLGYDVIIGHGAQFLEAAKIVAADNPDVMFVVNSNLEYMEPNVAGVNPDGTEMGIICGVAAAEASKTGKVGAIGGSYSPTTTGPLNGFAAGAYSVNPDIDVTLSIIDTWEDAAKAKEQAIAMIDAGVDVIMSDCDAAGFGVYEACTERGVYCIPTYGDQNDVAPENVIMSGLCDAGLAIKAMGEVIMDGKFEAKSYVFGVSEGCSGYSVNEAVYNELIDDEGKAAIDDINNKLANDEIVADDFIAEYCPDNVMLK